MRNTERLTRRQIMAAERHIVYRVVKDVLAAGYTISVHDGGEWVVKRSTDRRVIRAALFSTDEDHFLIRDAAGDRIGAVTFVYGNDGYDVIADHTATDTMETLLKGANTLADTYEAAYTRRYQT